MTPDIEQNVLSTTWAGFATSFAEGDRTAMAQYATTTVLESVEGSLDCGCRPWPTSYTSVRFSAPPQSTYPVSFLAEFVGKDYDLAPMTKEVVFTKSAAGSPWLITFAAAFGQGTPLLGASIDGSTPLPPVPTDITKDPAVLIHFLDNVTATGKVNPSLPPGFSADGMLTQVIDGNVNAFNQYKAFDETSVAPPSTVTQISPEFAVNVDGADPGVEICFAVVTSSTVTSTKGAALVQPADQSEFGYLLGPGSYSSLHYQGEDDNCIVEYTDGPTFLQALEGGTYELTGIPT